MDYIKEFSQNFDKALIDYFDFIEDESISEALRYVIKRGGKRIRPMIVKLVLEIYGHVESDFWNKYINYAIGLECIHMYSLIIDDLPCMDDDDYRNNMLTVHKVFGEAKAILIADLILSYGLVELSVHSKIRPVINNVMFGLIKGQIYDISSDKCVSNTEIAKLKTAGLFQLAFIIGGLCCSQSDKQREILNAIGIKIGMLFQYADNYIDQDVGFNIMEFKTTYDSILNMSNEITGDRAIIGDIINYITAIHNINL